MDDDLVCLDGSRMVLPNGAINKIMSLLHISHAWVDRGYEMARSLYFWPGILNDVKQLVKGCLTCLPENYACSLILYRSSYGSSGH